MALRKQKAPSALPLQGARRLLSPRSCPKKNGFGNITENTKAIFVGVLFC